MNNFRFVDLFCGGGGSITGEIAALWYTEFASFELVQKGARRYFDLLDHFCEKDMKVIGNIHETEVVNA